MFGPLHTGIHTPWTDTPPPWADPKGRKPPRQPPRAESPRQTPPWANTPRAEPPWADTPRQTPWADIPTHPRQTPQADTPWADTPLGRHPPVQIPRQTPWADIPPVQCMLGYGQQVGGMHPTGMHSCYSGIFHRTTMLFRWLVRVTLVIVFGLLPKILAGGGDLQIVFYIQTVPTVIRFV